MAPNRMKIGMHCSIVAKTPKKIQRSKLFESTFGDKRWAGDRPRVLARPPVVLVCGAEIRGSFDEGFLLGRDPRCDLGTGHEERNRQDQAGTRNRDQSQRLPSGRLRKPKVQYRTGTLCGVLHLATKSLLSLIKQISPAPTKELPLSRRDP